MGEPKATMPWQGRPAALHLAELLTPCAPLLLVVRPDSDWITPGVRASYRLVVNPQPERGMLSSVQCGLAAAPVDHAVVLTPVDCLGVTPETLRALLQAAAATGRSAVPEWRGRSGHPVLLSATDAAAVRAAPLTEGTTLASVLSALRPAPLRISVDDSSVLRNLNTPEDLRRAQSGSGR